MNYERNYEKLKENYINDNPGNISRTTPLIDSHFDGYEYRGFKVRTRLDIVGQGEYKPVTIKNCEDVYNVFQNLRYCDKERFYSILLDCKLRIIGVDLVSQGGLNSAPVHPREVFKAAIMSSALSIITVHNHPTGDSQPSSKDFEVTNRLKQAGEILGIDILDHVIIGDDNYYSFSHSDKTWRFS